MGEIRFRWGLAGEYKMLPRIGLPLADKKGKQR